MNALVSIIIPCYNAEQWVSEAIDSALSQTYSPVEVIVIDDGSTDKSLEIIKGYGERIRWETGANKGQSAARNRGFSLSNGKYIQWLDADDYIILDKIENQVSYLEEYGYDIVYSDWRYQYHKQNGNTWLSDVNITGDRQDILEALLAGLALTVMNCLMKREIVEKVNGFDEDMRAGEDVYFWIKTAIYGAKFGYKPGDYSVYRKYGNITVSSKDLENCCRSCAALLLMSLQLLDERGFLNETYKKSLAKTHFGLAKWYLCIDRRLARYHVEKAKELNPKFQPDGLSVYEIIFRIFGFGIAGYLFIAKTKLIDLLTSIKVSNLRRII